MRSPIVGLVCDRRPIENYPFHMVSEMYIAAMRNGAGALPLLIPALDPPLGEADVLASVDGLLLTGSTSNVSPQLYGGHPPRDPSLTDEHRDATAVPLVRKAIAASLPVLSICRGFQELNVAFGGTLHQHVHEVEGRLDHREPDGEPMDVQFGPAHRVTVVEGGLLSRLVGVRAFQVNSLHSQGIDKLAMPLHADAVAPDGQIEAVSMPAASGFVLGLQWHPEWRWAENDISRAIFAAFGAALHGRG
jgi:putative glutamine amidotransferase